MIRGVLPLQERENKFYIILGIYITSLIVANITASKVVSLWGLFVPAAVVSYSLTFLMTDTVSEIWGRDRARRIILMGFLMNIIMVALLQVSIKLPGAPFWQHQQEFQLVLGSSFRIVGASMAAYLISQYTDVWAFLAIKRATGGRYLWLRNNGSTYISQALDTIIFITIAFYGVIPTPALINMVLSQYILKFALTILNTPFFYLSVLWVRGRLSERKVLT